jgi:hypothetical protein
MTADPTALQKFQAIVLAHPALQHELRQSPDRDSFVALMLARAREHGCALEAAEVETALAAGARAWMLRWVQR